MTDSKPKQESRLCSEIQLFDLCDLDVCRYKSGRFCTNADLVERFDKISEDDDFPSPLRFVENESDDMDDCDDDFFVYSEDDLDAGDDEECDGVNEEE
ncbi:MAG TPA: hypothetical protein HPP94_16175 [Desulfuromonadales bacterium]|nr:hypothetical protein [Desulfuromonadales bacterium]